MKLAHFENALPFQDKVEREMIVKRTVEGLERRRRDGVILGRPPGSSGRKKLDGREEEIREYTAAGLSICQLARMLKVNRDTLTRFCDEKAIQLEAHPYASPSCSSNKWQKKGKEADRILNAEREYILSLMDTGLTNKHIVEKLREKGYELSEGSFTRWLRNDRELYARFVERSREIRSVRNAGCGERREHYKF
jgi:hypothetical protein